LEKQLSKVRVSLQDVEETETNLRERISGLVAKENQLTRRKEDIHNKISSIKEKVSKAKKIKEELDEF